MRLLKCQLQFAAALHMYVSIVVSFTPAISTEQKQRQRQRRVAVARTNNNNNAALDYFL